MSISFSASAQPTRTKSAGVLKGEERERNLKKDMPAYKRLREDGLQPPHIAGSAQLETRANDGFEVNEGKLFGKNLSLVKDVSSEIKDTKETKVPTP